jgi:hypothetical protein
MLGNYEMVENEIGANRGRVLKALHTNTKDVTMVIEGLSSVLPAKQLY